jgi:hypothetical protein
LASAGTVGVGFGMTLAASAEKEFMVRPFSWWCWVCR